jgi:hypothetical protein
MYDLQVLKTSDENLIEMGQDKATEQEINQLIWLAKIERQ